MNSAKIRLSEEEQVLVSDPAWILTKNRILKEVSDFLGIINETQQDWLKTTAIYLPEEVLYMPAKISKGENYLGLPYRVLDFPRCFEGDSAFMIRTFFWWGHFFSVTLQLSGRYKTMYEPALINSREILAENSAFICIDSDPWQHHFEPDYYIAVKDMSEQDYKDTVLNKPFVKMACKHALSGWESIPELLIEDFKSMIRVTGIVDQLPRR